ncbi:MAG TPA: quinone-dependent dihydroorotate dehydrogenase, partial [Candidatus Limnocylindria bacterium]|nr:quinone-dependent dihydroorotate dehydrogenase [Candidatus Limnocylindria bacterium]
MSGWRGAAYGVIRPLLFALDAERIHHLTLAGLRLAGSNPPGRGLLRFASDAGQAEPVELMGLRFRNRIGLGAGFDKDGVALRGWAALGFGFAEVGTVTPLPQAGNPRPRLFRLTDADALINRMGFNNLGADALAARLARVRPKLPAGFVVGVNIGRNRDATDELADYVSCYRAVAGVADYVAVNVSSPNTPGLRGLQEPSRLLALLDALAAGTPKRPLVVKLAPDLEGPDFDVLVTALAGSPAAGLVLSNTTVQHDGEAGGLSGRPLLPRMLAAIARARKLVGDRLVLIGSGGVSSGEDAAAVIAAGADLVQLWTGLVYRGPGLIGDAVRALAAAPLL